MNQEIKLFRVAMLLSRFTEQVNIVNSNGEFSINIHAENVLIKVLNFIFDCNLKNVNYEEGKTFPSIDLRDNDKKIAFQITSDGKMSKVRHTIEEYVNNGFYKSYDNLYILVITKKNKKYDQEIIDHISDEFVFKKENIIDRNDLYLRLNKLNDLEKIDNVLLILEKQFSDININNKWDIYAKGIVEYDKSIIEKFKYIEIRGFSPKIDNREVKISLNNIYVKLSLSVEQNKFNELTEIDSIIENNDRIVLLGDPGSGKSTLLKYLAFEICSNRSIYADIIPLYIRCADYAKKYELSCLSLDEYIINWCNKKFENVFLNALEKGSLFLMLDGLDEVSNINLRHDIIERFNDFISQNSFSKIIATSRKVGYSETRLNGTFIHYEVMEFSPEQIESFVLNWYDSTYEYENDLDKRELANKTIHDIMSNKSVKNLAKNPLLLTIICLINYQGITLPQNRVDLYDVATTTFLESWVKRRGTISSSGISKNVLIELLSPIAYYMHENYDDGLITEIEFKNKLMENYLTIYSYKNKIELEEDITNLLVYIKSETGFIIQKGNDINNNALFGFIHLTFQEYFASIELITRWKDDREKIDLKKLIINPSWHEVLVIAAEQFKIYEQPSRARKQISEFISDILKVDDILFNKNRPLKLVSDILSDEIDILPELFENIICKLIHDLFNEQNSNTPNTIGYAKFCIEKLIFTNTYGKRTLDYLYDKNHKNNKNHKVQIINILMDTSNAEWVHNKLVEILQQEDDVLKGLMFSYNRVYPIASIVKTMRFKENITKYVNKQKIKKIPTQYIYSYVDDIVSNNINYQIVNQVLDAIRNLNTLEKRQMLAEDSISSVSWKNVKFQEDFCERLKEEFPEIKCEKIINKVEERSKEDTYGIEIISTGIYSKVFYKTCEKKYTIKNLSAIRVVEYPLKESDFDTELKDIKLKDMVDLLNCIGTHLEEGKKKWRFTSIEEIELVWKYRQILCWKCKPYNLDLLAIKYILENIQMSEDLIIYYFDAFYSVFKRTFPQKIKINIDYDKLIKLINNSNIAIYQKVVVLSLLGKRDYYEEYIQTLLEQYNKKELDNIKDIKEILFHVI